ncbi:MAG TPA: VWA domain-containing protein [Pyrinomonadaceae bacterium]|nr:VWA domain-containing protein [Pyrinomonadaceae bacterium]
MRNKISALVCALLLAATAAPAPGQEQADEVLLVRTRAVFIDVLVRDKKTGEAVTGLKPENFRVLDDGKPRPLTYFSGEGAERKRPLALILVLNLPLYVEKPEVMEQIISALGTLRPDDEVAVMQVWAERNGPRPLSFIYRSKLVLDLTRDREKTYAALREVQKFAQRNRPEVEELLSLKAAMKAGWKDVLRNPDPTMQNPPMDITVAPDFEAAVDKAPLIAAKERPNSQVVVIESTDDDTLATYAQSREVTRRLLATGVTYNGLILKRDLFGKLVHFTGRVVSPMLGMRYEMTSHYSRQTGGEVAQVGSPESFAAAVSRIINDLSARYSLGFALTDADRDDGRLHKLEVKVKGRDARGRERKFTVTARKGYYMSTDSPESPTPAPGRVKNLASLAGAQ